jgi:hypothetical protein
MDRKAIMGIAAVAGIGLLLYMRKSGDSSALGSSSSLLGAASAASNWANQPIVINTSTKPNAVSDAVVGSNAPKPPPAPAPAPAEYSSFAIGGTVPGTAAAATTGQMTAAEHAEYQRRLGLGW